LLLYKVLFTGWVGLTLGSDVGGEATVNVVMMWLEPILERVFKKEKRFGERFPSLGYDFCHEGYGRMSLPNTYKYSHHYRNLFHELTEDR
jgi:hypothetical protein